MKKQPRIKVPESGVLRACLDLLAAEKIWHCRMNSGAFLPRGVGKGIVRAGRPGLADILASVKAWTNSEETGAPVSLRVPHFLWIECKSNTGRQSEDQVDFECEVRIQGHRYIVVRDVTELRQWLADNCK